MNFVAYAPKFTVKFMSIFPSQEKAIVTDDVIGVTTSKAYGRQSGTWQISVPYSKYYNGKRLDEIIIPNDYVEIASHDAHGKKVVIMAGLVSRVSVLRHVNTEGAPTRTIQISGEDIGKLFSAQLGWDISPAQMQSGVSVWESFAKRYVLLADTPVNMIRQVFNIFAETCPMANILIECGDWLTAADDWRILNPNGYLIEYTPAWSALKRLENDPWNILYCDTDDAGYFHLGLESQPFDINGKVTRPDNKTLVVDDTMITEDDLGVSDAERVNLLSLNSPLYAYTDASNPLDIVLIDSTMTHFDASDSNGSNNSIAIHGYHPHIVETEYTPQVVSEPLIECTDRQPAAIRAQTFWNWFRNNATYLSGTVTIHGNPAVRSGWRLVDSDRKREFLIEHVHHTYQAASGTFTTTLQVTRGVAL